jgi:hypothetical protein
VRDAIEAAGAIVRYLPPYSPDFNPIEMLFAKLKTLLDAFKGGRLPLPALPVRRIKRQQRERAIVRHTGLLG